MKLDKKNTSITKNLASGNNPEVVESENKIESEGLIKLSDATKESAYSKSYLLSAAILRKLKAKKIGGIWYTKKEWLENFASEAKKRKEDNRKQLSQKLGGEYGEFVKYKGEENIDSKASAIMRKKDVVQEAGILKSSIYNKGFFVRQAVVVLIVLMLINLSKTAIGMAEGMTSRMVEKVIVNYNEGIESIAGGIGKLNENMGGKIRLAEIGGERIIKIRAEIEKKKKEKEYEKKYGLNIEGRKESKESLLESEGMVAGIESKSDLKNSKGIVLAETAETLLENIGDIEVDAYVLDENSREIPNGEYAVRFSLYRLDRAEADPYPSDTDQASRVWEETRTVKIQNGLLAAYLGSVNPIPTSLNFANESYYLGIRVGEDAELIPRKRIGRR